MIRHLSHIFFVEALTFINTWVIIDSIDFRAPRNSVAESAGYGAHHGVIAAAKNLAPDQGRPGIVDTRRGRDKSSRGSQNTPAGTIIRRS